MFDIASLHRCSGRTIFFFQNSLDWLSWESVTEFKNFFLQNAKKTATQITPTATQFNFRVAETAMQNFDSKFIPVKPLHLPAIAQARTARLPKTRLQALSSRRKLAAQNWSGCCPDGGGRDLRSAIQQHIASKANQRMHFFKKVAPLLKAERGW